MKLYNEATGKIENLQYISTQDGTIYPSKVSEEQLNSYGYYKVEYGSTPNRRYFTSTPSQALEGNIYKIGYTAIPRSLEEVKTALKASIKERFLEKQNKPQVDTGLGFFVDGGYDKVKDFEIGKKYSFPSVRASDDDFYPVTSADYDTIITAIETYGITLFQTKWAKEAEVDALLDVNACILYEATPYDYTYTQEDIDAMMPESIDGEPVVLPDDVPAVGDIVVRYKNNCTEW